MERRVINPWTWQDQLGFVQANELKGAQRVLLCSGQTSVDDDGNTVNPGDMAGQVSKALDNLETVLGQAGLGLSDVVRLNIYATDVDAFFEATPHFMPRMAQADCRVASTLLGVTRLVSPDLLVELEATAVQQRITRRHRLTPFVACRYPQKPARVRTHFAPRAGGKVTNFCGLHDCSLRERDSSYDAAR